ncbi:MAG: MBL fold metallo-hydrolase [Bacteroidota bacterium]
MRIGAYEIFVIETGRFALDGGAMFGIIPKPLWERTNPADERNRIELAMRALLLVSEEKRIIIDVGIGTKFTEKLRDIYRVDLSQSSLESSLAAHGFKFEDITEVILTHLHFDHAGGATTRVNGEIVPAFPKAQYYVQKQHWEWALKPTEKDRGSFMREDFLPLYDHNAVRFIDGQGEFLPGIELLITNGHTEAQQLVKISDSKHTLLFCCDLIPTSSHVPLPYIMGYDLRPLITLEEKKTILTRAVEENWLLFLEHDPATEVITVEKTEKGFGVKERLSLSLMDKPTL